MEPKGTAERRSFVRVFYSPARRPRLTVGSLIYEVADINQGGLRLIISGAQGLQGNVSGTLTFPDGATLDIRGRIEWHQDQQIGMSFDRMIPEPVIRREQRRTILAAD